MPPTRDPSVVRSRLDVVFLDLGLSTTSTSSMTQPTVACCTGLLLFPQPKLPPGEHQGPAEPPPPASSSESSAPPTPPAEAVAAPLRTTEPRAPRGFAWPLGGAMFMLGPRQLAAAGPTRQVFELTCPLWRNWAAGLRFERGRMKPTGCRRKRKQASARPLLRWAKSSRDEGRFASSSGGRARLRRLVPCPPFVSRLDWQPRRVGDRARAMIRPGD